MTLKKPLKPADCLIVEDAPTVIRAVKRVGSRRWRWRRATRWRSWRTPIASCESLRPEK